MSMIEESVKMQITETIRIDPVRLPNRVYNFGCRTLYRRILSVLDNPEMRAEYERWKKERDEKMYYKKCPYCGAHLDPGERCDCEKKPSAEGSPQAARMGAYSQPEHNYSNKNVTGCQVSGNGSGRFYV